MKKYTIHDYLGNQVEVSVDLNFVSKIFLCEDMGDQSLHIIYLDGHEELVSSGSFDGDFDGRQLIYPERTCSECDKPMVEGYCMFDGLEYYCSDECLHKHYTQEEYLKLYDNGNGDCYWTTWEGGE